MRKLIENPVYMTYEEMEREFDGKWIYITKCNYSPYRELLGGFPVVIADKIFEGQDDGLYDRYMTSEYAPRTDRNFLDYEMMNLGVYMLNTENGGINHASLR